MDLSSLIQKGDVRVYRNLTKKCWSVQHRVKGKGWRLYAHMDSIFLIGCQFIVNKAGRERVRRENKKYVHAYIKAGAMVSRAMYYKRTGEMQINYNPYKNDTFMQNDKPVSYMDHVYLDNEGRVFSYCL